MKQILHPKKVLLVRVGADMSGGGGSWNAPIDSRTGKFAYVPIPDKKPHRNGLERNYREVARAVSTFGVLLPHALADSTMHLDPDYEHLTYGDQGRKGKQIASTMTKGDLLVFYSGLRCVASRSLIYAITGILTVSDILRAQDISKSDWHKNAHTRRDISMIADDIVVFGMPESSGRLERAIPIGEFRSRAYRVTRPLLGIWGGISATDGYLQRSARIPHVLNPAAFCQWWLDQSAALVAQNNPI
jgi:hypothetical protein